MSTTIGIDVGGTFIKGGRIGKDGSVLEELRVPSRAEEGPELVVGQIIHVAKHLASTAQIAGIGIGMPGLVSVDRNTVKYPPNFTGWGIVPLATRVSHAAGLPVVVDNDANCAAIGEAAFGAGSGISHFILATLGTGLGGGIIVDGKIFRGETGAAGEIGHTTIDRNGPQCKCGSFGCVEAYVGNRYFCERVAHALESRLESQLHALIANAPDGLTPELVAHAAEQGDAFARQQLYDAGYAVGVALANTMALFDIHTAILGGGVAQAGEVLFSGVRRAIALYSQKPMAESFTLLPAALGNRAGMLGASQLIA